jgi:ankyrin repeat protein
MNAVDLYAGYKSEEYKKRVSDLIYDAIKCGGPAMMEILIEALKKQERTEDNLKSIIEGDVKLLFAAVESNKYVVRILLENGANPNNMRLTDQTYYTPLIIASFIPGRFDVVKTLLEWSNAQENPQDKININAVAECITGNSSFESNTALYCASKDKRTFKLLLDNGADPTVGESVLVEVATKGNIELIDMVLDWSPKDKDSGKKVDINEIGVGGTALMKAVKHGHIKATQHLLERGADPTIVYKKNTALILAEQSQNPDLIKLISEAWLKKKEQDSIKLSKSSLSTSSFSTLQTLGKENTLGQSPVR